METKDGSAEKKEEPARAYSDSGDDEDSRDATLKIEENIKEEPKMELDISFPDVSNVKTEQNEIRRDLSLPQPAKNPPEKKKEVKTKREMEEEEREKMQYAK